MSQRAEVRDRLIDYLDRNQLSYRVLWGGDLEIQGGLAIFDGTIRELPDGLVVRGSLRIDGVDMAALPERLHIDQGLRLDNTLVSSLPEVFHVGQEIIVQNSKMMRLPANLHVHGRLSLHGNPIEVLPEGLHVDSTLSLGDTGIVRLPRDMFVGGVIYAPPHLLDMVAFMAAAGTEARLHLPASFHARMCLKDELSLYPDLWTIVESLGTTHSMDIHERDSGGFQAYISP